MLFFSLINKIDGIIFQNKIAICCDIEKEDIHKIAEELFLEFCEYEKLVPTFFTYELFIKDKEKFYKIVSDN
jgi:hypothetical protein